MKTSQPDMSSSSSSFSFSEQIADASAAIRATELAHLVWYRVEQTIGSDKILHVFTPGFCGIVESFFKYDYYDTHDAKRLCDLLVGDPDPRRNSEILLQKHAQIRTKYTSLDCTYQDVGYRLNKVRFYLGLPKAQDPSEQSYRLIVDPLFHYITDSFDQSTYSHNDPDYGCASLGYLFEFVELCDAIII